jgi:hypothetical protein
MNRMDIEDMTDEELSAYIDELYEQIDSTYKQIVSLIVSAEIEMKGRCNQ